LTLEKPEAGTKRKVLVVSYPFEKRRDKPSYVRLLHGFKSKTGNPGHVIAQKCKKCGVGFEPRLIAVNFADPSLQLWGCQAVKCRKFLIRFK